MVRDSVRARKVGGSLVVTLTKPVLDEIGVKEGDALLLDTIGNGRLIIGKEAPMTIVVEKVARELDILIKKRAALEAETDYIVFQHNNSMPTAHPGVEDDQIMEGTMKAHRWENAKLDTAVAEKRLELLEVGGTES